VCGAVRVVQCVWCGVCGAVCVAVCVAVSVAVCVVQCVWCNVHGVVYVVQWHRSVCVAVYVSQCM